VQHVADVLVSVPVHAGEVGPIVQDVSLPATLEVLTHAGDDALRIVAYRRSHANTSDISGQRPRTVPPGDAGYAEPIVAPLGWFTTAPPATEEVGPQWHRRLIAGVTSCTGTAMKITHRQPQ
jgi:hypothetical protein